jgi:hypothetical protein
MLSNSYRNRLTFFIFFCIFTSSTYAQWSNDPTINTAISTYAYYDKFVPVIVSDGTGGAIITWEDSRDDGSFFDIYAQRINASGDVLWTMDGVPISTGTGDRRAPAIVSDGAGGAIITWTDSRSGYGLADIYAQRINSSGVVKWTADGLAICTVAGDQSSQSIASDGSGGAIITWVDQRTGGGSGYKIYAQRIDSGGTIHSGWTTDGVAVRSNLSGSTQLPTIVGDGLGGAIITWADYRDLSNYHIYAQRINASGDSLWKANGVAICTYPNNQGRPVIVSDELAGAIIAWGDARTTSGDIYAQRINASGTVRWTVNGVALCSQPSSGQSLAFIAADGAGGALATWVDDRNGNQDIYAQRIDSSGLIHSGWTADGVVVCAATDNQYQPKIVGDGSGGAIITWHDNRAGTSVFDIYAQKINGSGIVQWTTDGAAVSTNPYWQGYPSITSDGAGGAIITWYDYRSGYNSDIYAQHIDGIGVSVNDHTVLEVPKQFELFQNYPNPFNPSTTIEFTLAENNTVTLKIFDLLGREVTTLVDGERKAGVSYREFFDASKLASGMYLYRLQTAKSSLVKKLLLVK